MTPKERMERIEALRKELEAFEAQKSDEGSINWGEVTFDGDEFSALKSDSDRADFVSSKYDEYENLVKEENLEREKIDNLRNKRLVELVPVDAPSIVTSKTSATGEMTVEKAFESIADGNREELPLNFIFRNKSGFETLGGKTIEREKADLVYPARWRVQRAVDAVHFTPNYIDFIGSVSISELSYPLQQPTAANDFNVGEQSAPGTALNEAAIATSIQDNNLRPVGAFSPFTWQTAQVPQALAYQTRNLGMALRSELDRRAVQGTGNLNGFGDRTYPTGRKVAVAADANVIDSISDMTRASYEARGEWPDFVLCSAATQHRLQTAANENSIYLAKASPEARPQRLWNMAILVSNHLPAGKIYCGLSMDILMALHNVGYQMQRGMSGNDFESLSEKIRAWVVAQHVFLREESLVEGTLA